MILPTVFEYEALSLILKEERRLRGLKTTIQRGNSSADGEYYVMGRVMLCIIHQ
jgi:hypothetical protein